MWTSKGLISPLFLGSDIHGNFFGDLAKRKNGKFICYINAEAIKQSYHIMPFPFQCAWKPWSHASQVKWLKDLKCKAMIPFLQSTLILVNNTTVYLLTQVKPLETLTHFPSFLFFPFIIIIWVILILSFIMSCISFLFFFDSSALIHLVVYLYHHHHHQF